MFPCRLFLQAQEKNSLHTLLHGSGTGIVEQEELTAAANETARVEPSRERRV